MPSVPPLPDTVAADPAGFLRALFQAAVDRAMPHRVLPPHLPPPPRGRTLVLGAGKAGGAMAAAVDALWPAEAPLSGLVITRYGHVPPAYRAAPGRIEVVEAAHPVPDAAGLAASQRLLSMTDGLTADDLVLCLISGGGSSLLTAPAEGLTLADKQRINQQLLASGAAIDEMNCVRKHLSAIKGGRLAARCAPAQVLTLLISDVPGDDPAVIASGPTVPDPTTCADALAVVDRYGIDLPPAARAALSEERWESPKPGDPRLAGQQVRVVATPRASLQAAADLARRHGVAAHVLGDDLEGESRQVGALHAALARSIRRHGTPFLAPCVLLSGGETTVTVKRAGGRGGRAGEFALGCLQGLAGEPGVWALAADTDGIDGSEGNAGALVRPDSAARAAAMGLALRDHLDRHDSYGWFERLDDLVDTGPTFTNVNDFRALLIT
jgi:hydroxypyruvate reductase